MPMILTTAIYPLSISWTRAPSSSSTRDTIRTTSFIRKSPSLLSLAFLSIVDATTRPKRVARKRERKSGKKSEKELSLWSQPLDKGAFSRCKKKELIQLLLAGPTSARPRPDQTNAVRWRRLFSFPRIPRESGSLFCRRRATLAPAKAFGKIPSSTHRHKRERKREKQ